MNILAMGDLHGRIPKLPTRILASRIDAMILAGDITPNFMKNWDMRLWNARKVDAAAEAADQKAWFVDKFMPWTKKFKEVKRVIFVAGNHDWIDAYGIEGVEFLQTGSKTIDIDGVKIGMLAGSMPYKYEWHDETDEYTMKQRIQNLDRDIDILVSHVPPFGLMDQAYSGDRIGCVSLREALLGTRSAFEPDQTIKSAYFENLQHHFFGHVHEKRGDQLEEIEGRQVKFHNVAETYAALEFKKE